MHNEALEDFLVTVIETILKDEGKTITWHYWFRPCSKDLPDGFISNLIQKNQVEIIDSVTN